MKLVADAAIPLLDPLFAGDFRLLKLPAAQLVAENLNDADVLLCRSVTRVNQQLLKGTPIQLVASPTSGIDHFDTDFLTQQHIEYCAAPGSNAPAVADYVLSVLAVLYQQQLLHGKRAGIIGVGHVGSRVQCLLEQLGFTVIVNDPPRAAREPLFHSSPLSDFNDLDLICIHASLSADSYHLLGTAFFASLKPGCVIINAARGAIIDTNSVLSIERGLQYCFDVFEQEPDINRDLVQRCLIATPHIAGYSIESKQRAIVTVAHKIYQRLNLTHAAYPLPPIVYPTFTVEPDTHWYEVILKRYNPLLETSRLKQADTAAALAQCFQQLRAQHQQRHEFATIAEPFEFK